MKTLLLVLAGIVGISVAVELSLRWFVGLGNPPLYIADEEIGYLLAPSQKTRRRGNKIEINQYSMRSGEITPEKAQDTFRVFLLGDSIVNGGWWTDDGDILSELVKSQLQQNQQYSDGLLEVFNASANSWNPRNEVAYLRKYGLFAADVLVLVINTDDLFGTAPSSAVVGKDRNYQAQNPPLAIVELYQRYFTKQQPIPELEKLAQEGGDRVGFNLDAIKEIKAIATANEAEFLLVMTPLLREVQQGSRDYEIKARKRLEDLVAEEDITYIDFLPIFNEFPQPEFLYRDSIHLSPQGETLVSKQIAEAISK